MPVTDEDVLHDLMHRATSDVYAPPATAGRIVARQRRRQWRTAAIGLTAAAAAGVTAFAAVTAAAVGGPARTRTTTPATTPALTLTAAQQTLRHLSRSAAAAPAPAGRYVVMKELAGNQHKTDVVDLRTGDAWTFQPGGHGVPRELFGRHDSPTLAQFAAYPTSVPALRRLLIAQVRRQDAQFLAWQRRQLAKLKRSDPAVTAKLKVLRSGQPKETANDMVFSQAAYLLYNPAVTPALRAALLRVIAATPGIVVNAHATDSQGRAAVEISRYDHQANYTEAIFEAPDGTRVLETSSITPPRPAQSGLPAQPGSTLSDTYLSYSYTNTRPATP
jgi:hypothetical protein